eukprot:6478028-Amphidinium_carterae.1
MQRTRMPGGISERHSSELVAVHDIRLEVCLASLFISNENKNFTGIAWLTMVFILGMLIMGPCAIVYGLCRKYLRGTKPF